MFDQPNIEEPLEDVSDRSLRSGLKGRRPAYLCYTDILNCLLVCLQNISELLEHHAILLLFEVAVHLASHSNGDTVQALRTFQKSLDLPIIERVDMLASKPPP